MNKQNADQHIREKINHFELQSVLPDADALWEKLSPKAAPAKSTSFVLIRYAAALLLIVVFEFGIWQLNNNNTSKLVVTDNTSAKQHKDAAPAFSAAKPVIETKAPKKITLDNKKPRKEPEDCATLAMDPSEAGDPSITAIDANIADEIYESYLH